MKNSRDLTLVIFFAVVSFVYTAFVGQMGTLITGIPGTNYLFVVGHAIFISSALLLYRGKRWRFFVQSVLFILLTIPTYFAGAPFDVVARIPIIFNNFIGDLLFNSLYGFFERREIGLVGHFSCHRYYVNESNFRCVNMENNISSRIRDNVPKCSFIDASGHNNRKHCW